MSTTPPPFPFPNPPQTAVDHFRTAEMHAACAAVMLTPGRITEDPTERADRLAQFDGHLALANLHTRFAKTMIAACGLVDDGSNAGELVAWRHLLLERADARAGRERRRRPGDMI